MPQGNASRRFLTGRAGELVCERENRTQDGREDAPDDGVFPLPFLQHAEKDGFATFFPGRFHGAML